MGHDTSRAGALLRDGEVVCVLGRSSVAESPGAVVAAASALPLGTRGSPASIALAQTEALEQDVVRPVDTLLEVRGLKKYFPITSGLLSRTARPGAAIRLIHESRGVPRWW